MNRLGSRMKVLDCTDHTATLASNIGKDGGTDSDIQVRIWKARTAFTILMPVWRSKLISRSCRKTKLWIFDTNLKSVLLQE